MIARKKSKFKLAGSADLQELVRSRTKGLNSTRAAAATSTGASGLDDVTEIYVTMSSPNEAPPTSSTSTPAASTTTSSKTTKAIGLKEKIRMLLKKRAKYTRKVVRRVTGSTKATPAPSTTRRVKRVTNPFSSTRAITMMTSGTTPPISNLPASIKFVNPFVNSKRYRTSLKNAVDESTRVTAALTPSTRVSSSTQTPPITAVTPAYSPYPVGVTVASTNPRNSTRLYNWGPKPYMDWPVLPNRRPLQMKAAFLDNDRSSSLYGDYNYVDSYGDGDFAYTSGGFPVAPTPVPIFYEDPMPKSHYLPKIMTANGHSSNLYGHHQQHHTIDHHHHHHVEKPAKQYFKVVFPKKSGHNTGLENTLMDCGLGGSLMICPDLLMGIIAALAAIAFSCIYMAITMKKKRKKRGAPPQLLLLPPPPPQLWGGQLPEELEQLIENLTDHGLSEFAQDLIFWGRR